MIKKFLFLLVLAVITITLFININRALAQFSGVLVYPSVVEMNFSGDKNFVSKVIIVENPSNKAFRVRAYMEGWNLDPFGKINFLEKPDEHSLNDYVKFNPKEFDIAPGQRQMVRLTSKLPEGLDGEFRSIIFFETINQKQDILDQNKGKVNINVTFKARYGVALYAYKGKTERNAVLQNAKFEKIGKDSFLIITLKNDGNIHTNVEGDLTLVPKDGSEAIAHQLSKYTILPGNIQKYRIQLPENVMNDGTYDALIKLNYKDADEKIQALEAQTSFIYKATKSSSKKDLLNVNVSKDEKVQKSHDNISKPVTMDNTPVQQDMNTEIKFNEQ